MPKSTIIMMLAVLAATVGPATVWSAAPPSAADPAGVEFFEKRIRPVLSQQCYKCHATTSEKVKGGLLLDSRSAAIQGGDTGPAIVPGHPEKSLFIEAVKYTNDDMKMPPKNKLPANVVADLTKWVQMGAPWPQDNSVASAPAKAPNYAATYDKLRKDHWAWQPLHDAPVPTVKNPAWAHDDIDRFVLAKLEEKGLKPVGDADKHTLIRRVTFDLTGLPPTPEDVASFVADTSPDALARRVDRLLASPAFGERWGRHWLDIARFAESTGSSRNVPYSAAWRYRDYVIDSFNQDKPYDRFITEQVAGDLLPYHSAQQHNEQLIATGFLAVGVKDLNEKDRVKYVMDNVDEQLDVTTRSILALTVACARCHDHKFDPIPQVDYYAMAGIFKSTDILSGVKRGKKGELNAPDQLYNLEGVSKAVAVSAPVAPAKVDTVRIDGLEAKAAKLRAELIKLRQQGEGTANERKPVRQQLADIESEISNLRAGKSAEGETPGTPTAMGVRDGARPADTAVCLHGEPHDLGQEVPRGFVSVVPVHSVKEVDPKQSGRLQLADWLTTSDNPLTPRVMVNRIWAHLFGEGIVRTVDNFGSTGEAPADPELLDHLALQFRKQGWSVKTLIRQIVLSHAYQLASTHDNADFLADPDDRLVWRMPSRRLDAEEIRDAMLSASGKIERSRPQGSVAASLPVTELKYRKPGDVDSGNTARSVYLPILRDLVPPVLDLFDFAEPTMVIGSRDTTTVPTQALYLMNDPFVIAQAHAMAERLQNATGMDDGGRVDFAYRLSLSRPPTPAEKSRAIKYISEFQHQEAYTAKDSLKAARADAWSSFCQALMGCAEFRYLN